MVSFSSRGSADADKVVMAKKNGYGKVRNVGGNSHYSCGSF